MIFEICTEKGESPNSFQKNGSWNLMPFRNIWKKFTCRCIWNHLEAPKTSPNINKHQLYQETPGQHFLDISSAPSRRSDNCVCRRSASATFRWPRLRFTGIFRMKMVNQPMFFCPMPDIKWSNRLGDFGFLIFLEVWVIMSNYPLVICYIAMVFRCPIEIDGLPITNGGSFHTELLVITRW